jgi:DNA-binding SARP family transcriptional activator/tetratricopeptide (TPR) repeat protein
MLLRVLGPLEVRAGDGWTVVPAPKWRALLAALLAEPDRVVATSDLIGELWGPDAPAGARKLVSGYVLRLRRLIVDPVGRRLVTQAPGYRLAVGREEIDAACFEDLLAAGRRALGDGNAALAGDLCTRAIALWRGPALADVPRGPMAAAEADRLDELRLAAVELRIDALMRSGHTEGLAAELGALTAKHPLREQLWCQLMLVLHDSGRTAEALAAYSRAQAVIRAELGADPGPGLQRLHLRLLRGDPPDGVRPGTPAVSRSARPVVPRELPGAIGHFTGRAQELQALTSMLDRMGGDMPGAVVISVVGGTAGVGKTALAVRWAHQVAEAFPDGQLYVNLRGYDPSQPMPAGDALAGFLRSLGVPGQDIPPEPDERTARYRSLLAGRRMLVVLDNAGSADQVRPLLPGTPTCAVVVTSRDALAGLVARDGATRLDLDALPLWDAVALLRTLIGARVDAEPAAAAELAVQCCRLPLALRVAAELAASRPAAPLAELTGELADVSNRLDLLAAGGDPSTGVRAVFSWSYRQLDAKDARTFRLLGLHPGPDVEPYAAAALADATVPQARRALEALARAHLVQPAAPGRYGMHDLLRGYARELSAAVDTGQEQHAALTRLFDHYLHTAATAMDTLYPAERHRRPRIPRPATPVPPLADPAAARDWLDGERAALVAAAGHTAAHGWPGHATGLAATLARYLRNGDHLPEAITIFSRALGAARRTSDRTAEATALNDIGSVHWQQNRLQQAADHYRQALALFRAAGDRVGEARVLGNMGVVETQLGRYEQAVRHQREAVGIFCEIDDRFGEAHVLGNLGWVRQRQGRYQEAADYHQQSLGLSREIGDRQDEAWALARLGFVDLRLGRYQHAAGYLRQALALFHEMGNKCGEAENLSRLGQVYLGLGSYDQAAWNFERALAMSRELGDRFLEADALNGLGELLFRTGDAGKARERHAAALRLASGVDSREQARSHSGLARACQAGGDAVQAQHHWQEALTRYAAIGAPEASEIRARLARAGDGGGDGDKPAEEDGGTAASSSG